MINRLAEQACRAGLPSLAKVCLSQPVRRQTMPIFFSISQVEQEGNRMLLPAFSAVFSAPKTEIAHAGRAEWRGGASHCPSCSPLFTQCRCLKKSYGSHFERKSPCRKAQRLSRSGMPGAWYKSGGKPGQTLLEHRASQNTYFTFQNPSTCLRCSHSVQRPYTKP